MALFQRKTFGKPGEWYYCLKHKKVEEGPECPAKDRFGPYTSPEEAAQAMDIARDRNVKWQNDPRWRDKTDDEDKTDGQGDDQGEDKAPGSP